MVHALTSGTRSRSVQPIAPPFDPSTILGEIVNVPNVDSFGRPIKESRKRFVLVMSCTSCSSEDVYDSLSEVIGASPAVVVVNASKEFLPLNLVAMAERVPVICRPESQFLPKQVFEHSPQFLYVAENGRV